MSSWRITRPLFDILIDEYGQTQNMVKIWSELWPKIWSKYGPKYGTKYGPKYVQNMVKIWLEYG